MPHTRCFNCGKGTFGLPAHEEDAKHGESFWRGDLKLQGLTEKEIAEIQWVLCDDCAEGYTNDAGTDYEYPEEVRSRAAKLNDETSNATV